MTSGKSLSIAGASGSGVQFVELFSKELEYDIYLVLPPSVLPYFNPVQFFELFFLSVSYLKLNSLFEPGKQTYKIKFSFPNP